MRIPPYSTFFDSLFLLYIGDMQIAWKWHLKYGIVRRYIYCFDHQIYITMYKFKKRNVSVYTIIDRRRVKINGKYPVKVEIIYKRKFFLFLYVVDHIKCETYYFSTKGHCAYFLLELVHNLSLIHSLLFGSFLSSLSCIDVWEKNFHIQNNGKKVFHTYGCGTL